MKTTSSPRVTTILVQKGKTQASVVVKTHDRRALVNAVATRRRRATTSSSSRNGCSATNTRADARLARSRPMSHAVERNGSMSTSSAAARVRRGAYSRPRLEDASDASKVSKSLSCRNASTRATASPNTRALLRRHSFVSGIVHSFAGETTTPTSPASRAPRTIRRKSVSAPSPTTATDSPGSFTSADVDTDARAVCVSSTATVFVVVVVLDARRARGAFENANRHAAPATREENTSASSTYPTSALCTAPATTRHPHAIASSAFCANDSTLSVVSRTTVALGVSRSAAASASALPDAASVAT